MTRIILTLTIYGALAWPMWAVLRAVSELLITSRSAIL